MSLEYQHIIIVMYNVTCIISLLSLQVTSTLYCRLTYGYSIYKSCRRPSAGIISGIDNKFKLHTLTALLKEPNRERCHWCNISIVHWWNTIFNTVNSDSVIDVHILRSRNVGWSAPFQCQGRYKYEITRSFRWIWKVVQSNVLLVYMGSWSIALVWSQSSYCSHRLLP